MDYGVALLVYICGLLGVLICIGGLIGFSEDKAMVKFLGLISLVFAGIVYLGGMMLNAIS